MIRTHLSGQVLGKAPGSPGVAETARHPVECFQESESKSKGNQAVMSSLGKEIQGRDLDRYPECYIDYASEICWVQGLIASRSITNRLLSIASDQKRADLFTVLGLLATELLSRRGRGNP